MSLMMLAYSADEVFHVPSAFMASVIFMLQSAV